MDAPTLVTLRFPQFGKEPVTSATLEFPQFAKEPATDLNEDPLAFVKEPATDSSRILDPDNSDNLPAVILPRRRTIANFFPRMSTISSVSNITGVALIAGALVQIYYSGLAPLDAWSAPALCSFLAIMLLNVLLLF